MKKFGLLVLVMFSIAQVSNTAADYSKMSANELNETLIVAVKKGSYDQVKKLVELGADSNQKTAYTQSHYDDYDSKHTCSLLEYAAKHGYVDIVKELGVKAKNEDINEALVLAAEEGHADVVRELIQASDAKLGALSRLKCLFVGSEKCQICVNKTYRDRALIRAAQEFPGITINSSSGSRYRTALKDYSNVIKELIKAGANVNHADKFGNTALIIIMETSLYTQAQKKDREEIIQALLKAKANVNHANKESDTALIRAIRKHDFDAVQFFLNVPGININYANREGNTALITALQNVRSTYSVGNSEQYNECVNSQKIVEVLLQTPGIDLYHVNKNGATALTLLKKVTGNASRY